MSIRSAISSFLDASVEARFKRDARGALVFFPWGFGTGRMLPDSQTEAALRRATRHMLLATFAVVIPIISLAMGMAQLRGSSYLAFFAACMVLGFAMQLYPYWTARHLPYSEERMSYAGAAIHSLDRFGMKFVIFGLVTSAVFTITATLALCIGSDRVVDPTAMIIALIVFAPMTVLYARELLRRRGMSPSA